MARGHSLLSRQWTGLGVANYLGRRPWRGLSTLAFPGIVAVYAAART
jgi:hypothetical protein